MISTADRVNCLFTTFHARTEPEQSTHDVAAAVSTIVGRPVPAQTITALRVNHDANVAPDVLEALAQHFGVTATYLTDDSGGATDLHHTLRLLAAARDAGVRGLALRGDTASPLTVAAIVELLSGVDS